MDDLSFLPSDFAAIPSYKPEELALWANKKLARKLDKATKVYAGPGLINELFWGTVPVDGYTHSARLVCVQEVKKPS